MKFTAIAIIKTDPDILNKIRVKLLEKSKAYISEDMIKTASLLPNVDMSNNQAVAKAISELTGDKTYIDEGGIYLMDTVFKNELIKQWGEKIEKPLERLNFFDYFSIFDLMMTDDLIVAVDGYDRFPNTIVTPDLKLIQAPKGGFMFIDELNPNHKEFIKWTCDFKEILKKYSNNSFSLILDCHI